MPWLHLYSLIRNCFLVIKWPRPASPHFELIWSDATMKSHHSWFSHQVDFSLISQILPHFEVAVHEGTNDQLLLRVNCSAFVSIMSLEEMCVWLRRRNKTVSSCSWIQLGVKHSSFTCSWTPEVTDGFLPNKCCLEEQMLACNLCSCSSFGSNRDDVGSWTCHCRKRK